MELAIVAVTKRGIETARKINKNYRYKCRIYTLEKYCDSEDITPIKTSITEEMQDIFGRYTNIVLIMACGIAVRVLAPYIASKKTDPAVVVLDDAGKNVISLLSGHIGGANELAVKIAAITGGNAIITTASDNQDYESVDMIAKRFDLILKDFDMAKKVTADIVNDKRVGLISKINLVGEIKAGVIITDFDMLNEERLDSCIYIGNDNIKSKINIPMVQLFPKNIILGIGCRKNTDKNKLIDFVNRVLEDNGICSEAVKLIATIDIKKDEAAIKHLGKTFDVSIKTYSPNELKNVEDRFEASQFVKKTVGVGAVCEPSAYLASNMGRCLVKKVAAEGITLCVYEDIQK